MVKQAIQHYGYKGTMQRRSREIWEMQNRKKTINIHNKFYSALYEEGRIDELAVWLMLQYYYPNKRIWVEKDDAVKHMNWIAGKLNMGKSTFKSVLAKLINNGLIEKHVFAYQDRGYILILNSKKVLDEKFGASLCKLFIDIWKLDKYSRVKYFLKQIPLLSNLKRQGQLKSYHEYFGRLRKGISSGEKISSDDIRALKRYENKMKDKSKKEKYICGSVANLSLSGICRVTDKKSHTTALRYKKFLKDNMYVQEYHRTKILREVESKEHFYYLKFEKKSIPKHALLTKDNKAFVYLSSALFPLYNADLFDQMIDYYEENLEGYVDRCITNRNQTSDLIRQSAIAEAANRIHGKTFDMTISDPSIDEGEINKGYVIRDLINYVKNGGDLKEVRVYAENRKRLGEDDFTYTYKTSIPKLQKEKDFGIVKITKDDGITLGSIVDVDNTTYFNSPVFIKTPLPFP